MVLGRPLISVNLATVDKKGLSMHGLKAGQNILRPQNNRLRPNAGAGEGDGKDGKHGANQRGKALKGFRFRA